MEIERFFYLSKNLNDIGVRIILNTDAIHYLGKSLIKSLKLLLCTVRISFS